MTAWILDESGNYGMCTVTMAGQITLPW